MSAKHPTLRSILWQHRCWCFMVAAACTAGCGIHYYDGRTGTEHLWGFGHLRMRIQEPAEGIQAVVKGVQTTGAKFGVGTEEYGFLIGYDNRRTVFVSPTNAAFVLEWPDASFFNLRVGTNPPFLPKDTNQSTP
jgi:hypothetical protein